MVSGHYPCPVKISPRRFLTTGCSAQTVIARASLLGQLEVGNPSDYNLSHLLRLKLHMKHTMSPASFSLRYIASILFIFLGLFLFVRAPSPVFRLRCSYGWQLTTRPFHKAQIYDCSEPRQGHGGSLNEGTCDVSSCGFDNGQARDKLVFHDCYPRPWGEHKPAPLQINFKSDQVAYFADQSETGRRIKVTIGISGPNPKIFDCRDDGQRATCARCWKHEDIPHDPGQRT